MNKPVVLTVAGSDSAGMAGLQMDVRTQAAMGVHSACAVTANTAQTGDKVVALHAVAENALRRQLEAAVALRPRVVKAGMLAHRRHVQVLAQWLESTGLPLVYDPVLAASSGHPLYERNGLDELRRELLPRARLVTPNLVEARMLAGLDESAGVEQLARELYELGPGAVLIKGGHAGGEYSRDYFYSGERRFWLSSPRMDAIHVRGTGCALASTVASALALDYSLEDAVVIGKMAVNQGLRQGYGCEAGMPGPVQVTGFPDQMEDLPALHAAEHYQTPESFPDCGDNPLGLYPIVDRAEWVDRLAPLGVATLQLRIKDLAGDELVREIGLAVASAQRHGCRLFINDYWRLAIEQGAYGVHLGQQDLGGADLDALRRAGLRLGVSTHCHWEIASAHAVRPSYIAFGPVYHTTTKAMPWIPRGPEGLKYWRKLLADYPLVAIGGIDESRLPEVAAAGADGIALITAITRAQDPEAAATRLLSL